MIKDMIEKAKIRKILWLNKISLVILKKAFTMYRKHSKVMVDSLTPDTLWASGIEFEEQHLDSTERIIERRLQASINKKKNRRKK